MTQDDKEFLLLHLKPIQDALDTVKGVSVEQVKMKVVLDRIEKLTDKLETTIERVVLNSDTIDNTFKDRAIEAVNNHHNTPKSRELFEAKILKVVGEPDINVVGVVKEELTRIEGAAAKKLLKWQIGAVSTILIAVAVTFFKDVLFGG